MLDAIEAIPRVDEAGVRYTSRDQWHVTLVFLGSVDIDLALDRFRPIAAPSCDAVLGPAVSRLGRSVAVLPVAGLDSLAAAVRAAMGDGPDERDFTGHLTIARLKHRGACRVAGHPFRASFTVEHIDLVQSHLSAEGSRYETLASVALGP